MMTKITVLDASWSPFNDTEAEARDYRTHDRTRMPPITTTNTTMSDEPICGLTL